MSTWISTTNSFVHGYLGHENKFFLCLADIEFSPLHGQEIFNIGTTETEGKTVKHGKTSVGTTQVEDCIWLFGAEIYGLSI